MRIKIWILLLALALFSSPLLAQTYFHAPGVAEGYLAVLDQGENRCYEDNTNGTNYFFTQAAAAMASNIGFLYPSAAATGLLHATNAAGTMTLSVSGIVTGDITDGTIAQADIDDTQTIGADPANGASSVWFGTTGLIGEGSTSDAIETLLTFADPTVADKTVTIPNTTGTVLTSGDTATVTATIMAADSVGASELIEAADYTAQTLKLSTPIITPGAELTVNNTGELRRQVFTGTADFGDFTAAATTDDYTIGTLPAKTVIYRIVADVITPFVCAAVCTTAQLSMTCGKTAGGNEYLASFDIDAAAAVFGDGIAEVGAAINATNLQDIPSWAGTTTLQCRLTSGIGNIGDGATTNFNAGQIKFYVDYAVLP